MPAKTKEKTLTKRPPVDRSRRITKRVPPVAMDPSGSASRFATKKLPIILCFILAAITIGVYSPVGEHPFVNYDDQYYVLQNAHVKEGLSWDTLTWAITSTEQSNWHPLTWLSHALDYQLFGMNPSGHHWTSVLIHAANVVFLFLLLWIATRAVWRSFIVAALFGLHPLNVESVAWIAERKNVLSTLFFLLALGAYGWYARKPDIRRYLAVALLFVMGLASKPMVITLPFVLMLLDYWPLRRIENWSEPSTTFAVPQENLSRLVLEKLPLLALSLGSAIVTMLAQKVSVVPTGALPIAVRLKTSIYAYGMYLWKAVWPARLALIYPHPGRGLPGWEWMTSAAVLVAVTAVAWQQRSKRPYVAVGWLWFLGTAVPIIGIVQVGVQAIADRYAYVPLIGIFVLCVWAASSLADQFRVGPVPRIVSASLILVALTFATWQQVGYWRSTLDLWTHALQVTEGNTIAENSLATELFAQGRYQEAMVHLRNYARLEPFDPKAHVQVGADYQDHGQISEAAREYESAIQAVKVLNSIGQEGLPPDMLAMTYANLALCSTQLGDATKAQQNTKNALDLDADAIEKMVSGLAQYLSTHPAAPGYARLGMLLQLTRRQKEAQQAFIKARLLDPNLPLPPAAEQNRH